MKRLREMLKCLFILYSLACEIQAVQADLLCPSVTTLWLNHLHERDTFVKAHWVFRMAETSVCQGWKTRSITHNTLLGYPCVCERLKAPLLSVKNRSRKIDYIDETTDTTLHEEEKTQIQPRNMISLPLIEEEKEMRKNKKYTLAKLTEKQDGPRQQPSGPPVTEEVRSSKPSLLVPLHMLTQFFEPRSFVRELVWSLLVWFSFLFFFFPGEIICKRLLCSPPLVMMETSNTSARPSMAPSSDSQSDIFLLHYKGSSHFDCAAYCILPLKVEKKIQKYHGATLDENRCDSKASLS